MQSPGTVAPRGDHVSIIVPVLDEALRVRAFLLRLRQCAPGAEIIVVDGGSGDGTAGFCQGLADRVLTTCRGRALQMNAGAAAARGEVLWFLHADSRIPPSALTTLQDALAQKHVAGGCFRIHFPRRAPIYRVSDSLGNFAVDLFGIALGDHGIFCRRAAFARVGGFPEIPLMEDAEFYRALHAVGGLRQLRTAIETSPRRYEQLGAWRTTAVYLGLLALYLVRVSPERLGWLHGRFVHGRADASAPPEAAAALACATPGAGRLSLP